MASVQTKWINEIIRTVAGMTPDGDAQIEILARAFIVGCRSCSVEPDNALAQLQILFEENDMTLVPLESVVARQ